MIGPAAAGVPTDDHNLVRRALDAVDRTAAVLLKKRIPAGGGLGGTNPIQVGLGVQVAATNTNLNQGANQTTGRPTDLMINGDSIDALSTIVQFPRDAGMGVLILLIGVPVYLAWNKRRGRPAS